MAAINAKQRLECGVPRRGTGEKWNTLKGDDAGGDAVRCHHSPAKLLGWG